MPSFPTPIPGPSGHGQAITPSDTEPFPVFSRAIYVGGAGNLTVLLAADTAPVTFQTVPAGTILEVCVIKVMATDTTATEIVALF